MAYYEAWQGTIRDGDGDVVVSPVVTVRNKSDNTLATIYSSNSGASSPNPITGSVDGFVKFWLGEGEYVITASDGVSDSAQWDVRVIDAAARPSAISKVLSDSGVVAYEWVRISDMPDGGAAIRNARHTSWYQSWGPFPEVALIVAYASSVKMYDATDPILPEWGTFQGSGGANMAGGSASSGNVTCVAMRGGKLIVGQAQGTSFGNGIVVIDFAKDEATRYRSVAGASFAGRYLGGIGQANDGLGWDGSSAQGIIGGTAVNSVASFVYPDAPCDPETGLPIATIAVGTVGGLTFVNAHGAFSFAIGSGVGPVAFDDNGNCFAGYYSKHTRVFRAAQISALSGSATIDQEYVVAHLAGGGLNLPVSFGAELARGGSGAVYGRGTSDPKGVVALREYGDKTRYAATMVAPDHSDTQLYGLVGSWLNSADDADLVGGELVTNGDFASSISGAVNSSIGTGSIEWDASGAMLLTSNGSANVGIADFQVTGLTVGKEYVATYVVGSTTGSLNGVKVGTTQNGTQYHNVGSIGTGVVARTFTATSATAWLRFTGFYGTGTTLLDSVSLRRADPDRSVSGKGLAVYGTVQKSEAVAGSGGLMAYGGFSASNYLQQPYNSAMDFGTGDFTIAALIYGADSLSTATIMSRAASNITGWHMYKETTSSTGALKFRMAGAVLSGTSKIGAGWYHVAARRIGSTVDLIVNGRVEATYTVSTTMSSTAPLQVGWSTVTPMVSGLPAISQAQVYARGLSDDEISALYRLQRAALYGKTTLRSGDIKAIASDPYTGDLHVLTAVGRQVFDGRTLQEVEFEAGTWTKIAAHGGAVAKS